MFMDPPPASPVHDPIRNRNKRRMAWTCLTLFGSTNLGLLAGGLFSEALATRISRLGHVLTLWDGGLVSVILTYMGASVASSFLTGRKQ